MKTRLVRIGNSRGIRLPKPVIEEAGLAEEIELRVRPGAIVIAPFARQRVIRCNIIRARPRIGGVVYVKTGAQELAAFRF